MWSSIKRFYKKYSSHTLFILATFILFWPLAVYLMWKHKKWGVVTRGIVTAIFIGFTLLVGVAVYNSPPSIVLNDESVMSGFKTDNDYVSFTGTISTLQSAALVINGTTVPLGSSGDFSYKLPLKEGDTAVVITAKSEKGTETRRFSVHRTTSAELVERKKVAEEKAKQARIAAIKAMPTCDGVKVTANCTLDDVVYITYVHHAAVPEKTHDEPVVTYKQEVTGYCTLCNDGSRSPSCSTGRGTCSYHGGVAQWNAPITTNVPVYSTKTVVDSPAQDAYTEKVVDNE